MTAKPMGDGQHIMVWVFPGPELPTRPPQTPPAYTCGSWAASVGSGVHEASGMGQSWGYDPLTTQNPQRLEVSVTEPTPRWTVINAVAFGSCHSGCPRDPRISKGPFPGSRAIAFLRATD